MTSQEQPLIALCAQDDDQRELLKMQLYHSNCKLITFATSKRLLEFLELGGDKPELLLVDLKKMGAEEAHLLQICKNKFPNIPIVAVIPIDEQKEIISSKKLGVAKTLFWPLDMPRLQSTISTILDKQTTATAAEETPVPKIEKLIGSSSAITSVQQIIDKVADSTVSVLIQGEVGTCKQLAARTIHNKSNRKDGPFVVINCAAIPKHLIAGVLFGNVKNNQTSAFQKAEGGTILLEEISELPLEAQAMLLQTMQEKVIQPLHGDKKQPCNVRILSSTNRNLVHMMYDGSFREDLFYRLTVFTLDLPPLRKRKTDIAELAEAMLQNIKQAGMPAKKLSTDAIEIMQEYSWPGNVKQLETVISRANLTATGKVILPEHLYPLNPVSNLPTNEKRIGLADKSIHPLEQIEEEYIKRALDLCGGSVSLTARRLGIGRATLYRKISTYQENEQPNDSTKKAK